MENEVVEAARLMDYLQHGKQYDKFYNDKVPATLRQLKFYMCRIKCEELRIILKRKIQYLFNQGPTS